MKKIATLALTAAAVLSLTACGKSDKASEGAQADNVEMPAEEAVNTADEAATPVADTGAASDAATTPAATAAGANGANGAKGTGTTSKAAEDATRAAEKKM